MYPLRPPEGALPPDKVRFIDVKVEPWPDGNRVKVLIHMTPFLKPPNLEERIENSQGETIAHADIIETNTPKLALTLHLKGQETGISGQFTLFSRLYYPDLESGDTNQLVFQI